MVELAKDAQENGGDTYRENDVVSRLLDNGNAKAIENTNVTQSKEKSDPDTDPTMTEEINKLLRDMPLTDDLTCGFWIFKGRFFQR